ncbi:16175_t:CDS:2, partial [Funneliformis geosporum]
ANIAGHLRSKHRIIDGKEAEAIEDLENERIFPLEQNKIEKITSRLLAWLIDDMQAFHVIDNIKFREFVKELEPSYPIPCKNSLYKKMSEAVSTGEKNLYEYIKNSMDTFFFTTDLWTQNHSPYIGITIHWMAPDFKINQALLTIANFQYPYSGDNIEDYLRNEFQKWELMSKLFEGTTDNDFSMIKAMRQLETNLIRCVAHTMQLAIKDGLKNIKNLIDIAKKLNNFISSRDKYRNLLKVTFCEINSNETNIRILDPIASDTEMRWNSLSFYWNDLLFRNALAALADKLVLDSDRSTRIDDWTTLEELILLLQPFENATNLTSGSTYPTFSLWYPTLYCLRNCLNKIACNIKSPQIKIVCNEILASLSRRWDNPDELGCIASFLDPRFKFLNFLSEDQIESTKQSLKTRNELLETPVSIPTTPHLNISNKINENTDGSLKTDLQQTIRLKIF